MIELFRHRDFTCVGYYQSILESEGIATHVRNQHLTMAGLSEIPIPEFYPALCVVNESDKERALQILRERNEANQIGFDSEIHCPNCAEPNPGNFEICWSCGGEIEPPTAALTK